MWEAGVAQWLERRTRVRKVPAGETGEFVSKLIEKIVFNELSCYLDQNYLCYAFRSAHHSTETCEMCE